MESVKRDRLLWSDILRLLSTFFIIAMHGALRSNILYSTKFGSAGWCLSYTVFFLGLTGLDMYVVLAAMFQTDSDRTNIGKIFNIWGQLYFTTAAVSIVLRFMNIDFSGLDYVYTFLPFTTKTAWYVNVYILLYLLHPYLNRLIRNLGRNEYKRLVIIMLLFFCLAQSVIPEKTWTLDDTRGYGIIWFVTLYFATGYYKKYLMHEGVSVISVKNNLAAGILSVIISLLSKLIIHRISILTGHGGFAEDILIQLNSVSSLIFIFSCLGIFSRLRNENIPSVIQKYIRYAIPSSLGIYLISTQFKMHMHLWTDILHLDRYSCSVWAIPLLLWYSFVVCIVCMLLDKLRHKLAVLTVNRLKIGERLDAWQQRITENTKN